MICAYRKGGDGMRIANDAMPVWLKITSVAYHDAMYPRKVFGAALPSSGYTTEKRREVQRRGIRGPTLERWRRVEALRNQGCKWAAIAAAVGYADADCAMRAYSDLRKTYPEGLLHDSLHA